MEWVHPKSSIIDSFAIGNFSVNRNFSPGLREANHPDIMNRNNFIASFNDWPPWALISIILLWHRFCCALASNN
jgi:hypothetical protein